jgi:hypothetical protein
MISTSETEPEIQRCVRRVECAAPISRVISSNINLITTLYYDYLVFSQLNWLKKDHVTYDYSGSELRTHHSCKSVDLNS